MSGSLQTSSTDTPQVVGPGTTESVALPGTEVYTIGGSMKTLYQQGSTQTNLWIDWYTTPGVLMKGYSCNGVDRRHQSSIHHCIIHLRTVLPQHQRSEYLSSSEWVYPYVGSDIVPEVSAPQDTVATYRTQCTPTGYRYTCRRYAHRTGIQ